MASTSSMKMIAGAALRAAREQVAHARCADTDEQLDEARAGKREERHVGLTGHRAREQCLAGTGRSDHQHAARRDRARRRVTPRVLQEVDDFTDLAFRTFVTGDVDEAGLGSVLVVDLGLRRTDAHDAARERTRGAAADPEVHADEDEQRQQATDDAPEARRARGAARRDLVGRELGRDRVVVQRGRDRAIRIWSCRSARPSPCPTGR